MAWIVSQPGQLQIDHAQRDLRRRDGCAQRDRPALGDLTELLGGISVIVPPLFEHRCGREWTNWSSDTSTGLNGPEEYGDRVGLIVIGWGKPALPHGIDNSSLVGIALAGCKALDGPDRHALISD
jgi:hypothetical protein